MSTTLLQRICAAGVFSVTLIASAVAYAADPSPDAMAKSSALYKQARALHTRGKWAEAEAAYQAAWNLRRTFDIAGNLGDCELHVGQPREAAEHLSFALKNVPAGVLPEQTEALRRMLKEAKAQIGTLRIALNVAGAELVVDGRPVEDSSEVFVDPGSRTIEARLAGYVPVSTTIAVRAGATEKVDLVLVAQRRSAIPAIVMGSVGGIALAAGIGVLVASGSKASSVRELHDAIVKSGHRCVAGASNYDPRCEDLHSAASSGDALHNAGVGLLVGAGAAAVGTVLYLVWPQSSPSSSRAGALRVTPALSPTTTGLIFSGTF